MNEPKTEPTEPLFYIHWRNEASGKAGRESGLYSEFEAKVWIAAFNRDPSNIKQGLVYWMVPK